MGEFGPYEISQKSRKDKDNRFFDPSLFGIVKNSHILILRGLRQILGQIPYKYIILASYEVIKILVMRCHPWHRGTIFCVVP